jgi:two-component system response regulator FixJ
MKTISRRPTVFLIDDDEDLLIATSTILKMHGYEVREYASAETFLAEVDHNAAGCLLTDMRLPGMRGIELQQVLLSRNINLPMIFITGYGEVNDSVQAVKAGAFDFLEKPVAPDMLLDRVKEALRLDQVHRRWDSEHLILQKRYDTLSPREKDVITKVVDGETNKEIAKDLEISYRTVEKYRANAMLKLEADNVVELTKLSHNIFEMDSVNNSV